MLPPDICKKQKINEKGIVGVASHPQLIEKVKLINKKLEQAYMRELDGQPGLSESERSRLIEQKQQELQGTLQKVIGALAQISLNGKALL